MYRLTLWFFRQNERKSRSMGRFARLLAKMLHHLAHLLRGSARQHVAVSGSLLENFAQTVEQTQQGRSFSLISLLFLLFDAFILGFWSSAVHSLSTLIGSFSWIIAIILVPTFLVLMLFLVISGDIYFEKRDEAQKAATHEAATFAMGATIILLALFTIIDKSAPVWQHNDIYQTLTLTLIVLMRIIYMLRLVSLRWHELIIESDLDALQQDTIG